MQLLENRQSLALYLVQCLRRAQSDRRTDLFNAFRRIQVEGDWSFYFDIVANMINSTREEDVVVQEQSAALQ